MYLRSLMRAGRRRGGARADQHTDSAIDPAPRSVPSSTGRWRCAPRVGMIGEGVATLELRRSHQSACARVQNGAWQVMVEGTRRVVPIGTSSSSFSQSSRLVSRLPLLGVPFLAARTSTGRKGIAILLHKVR